MRVYSNFFKITLVLTGLWLVIGVPANSIARETTAGAKQPAISEPSSPANFLNYTEYYVTTDTKAPEKSISNSEDSIFSEQCAPETACDGCCMAMQPCRTFYIDYRIQQMFGYTSYEFGTDPTDTQQYAPLSKLNFSLDSTWNGLRIGVQRCNWDIHLEWLMPMVQHINGNMADYDWNIDNPRNNPTRLDSLTHSSERWNDGQQLELEGDYKYSDCFLGMPIEVWPLAGFRWQRFDITAYDIDYIIPPLGPYYQGDVITFNQQYYTGYIGAQFRRSIERECRPPINLAFQFDWGATGAYNVDHHLLREGDRYTMESTGGDTVHFSLRGDVPLTCRLSLGLEAGYTRIRTTGTHRHLNTPLGTDESWSNGVLVKSEQTSLTAYMRYNW